MIETVVALCMFMMPENKLIEHRIQTDYKTCLSMKRESMRNSSGGTDYRCGKVMAVIELNIDGSKSIKKIVKSKDEQEN
tara:strand:+ start:663 stop:899 length:237 start_codon:yes stop_codon:yes gene_type:complete